MQPKSEPRPADTTDAASGPIVVDLGKRSKKQIRALREGKGKLLSEVDEVVGELKKAGTLTSSNATVVIVVVRPREQRGLFGLPY